MWQLDKWDISSLKPLAAIDNVHVINQPCTIKLNDFPVSFLPYVKDPIVAMQCIENIHPYKLLFSHIAIDGALWNSVYGSYSDVAVEHDGELIKVKTEIFKDWDRVFLGHYHAAQKLNDYVEYIGSPLQLNYGEAFQDKHIGIFDLETKTVEYVKNCFSPKHLVYTLEQASKIKPQSLSGDFVKIRTNNITSPENLEIQRQLSPHFAEVKVEAIPKQNNKTEERDIIDNAKAILYQDETKMAEFYIDTVGVKKLNREELMKVFKEITSKRKQDA
jgi:DNA repair exonuclease SbcCD nuclease subunit